MTLRVIHGDDPDYTIDKFLGAGGFGEVFKVRRKLDGQVCDSIVPVHDAV